MSIQGSLEFASNLAATALRDAEAVDRLVASLGALGALGGAGGGAPFDDAAKSADKLAAALAKAQQAMDLQGLKGSQAADLVQQKANAAADLATQKGSQAAVLAAQKAQAQLDAIAAKGAESRQTAAAKAAADSARADGKKADDAARAADREQKAAERRAQQATQRAEKQTAREEKAAEKAAQKAQAQADKLAEREKKDADRKEATAAKAAQKAAEKAVADRDKADEQIANRNTAAGAALLGGDVQGALKQFGPEGEAAAAVLSVVEKIVGAVAGLLKAGADIAIASGTFREDTVLAFEGLLGGEQAAAALYEKALDLSDKTGLSKEAVVAKLQKQISAGVSEADALREVNTIAAATLGLGEGKASKIDSLLTKIAATDKVSSRVFESLGVAGIAADDLYAKLGATTGKTRKELELLAKQGKLSSAQVSDAIQGVVEDKFGKLRDKAGQTIPRILGDIQDEFTRLFDKVTGTEGAGQFKGLLSGFSDMLTGPEGEKLRGAFNELFGNIFGMLGGAVDLKTASGVFDQVAAAIQRVGEFVKDITPGVQGFAKGLLAGFSQMGPILSTLPSLLMSITGGVGGLGTLFEYAGKGIAYFIGALVLGAEIFAFFGGILLTIVGTVVAGVAALLGALGSAAFAVYDFFAGIPAAVSGAGDTLSLAASDAGGNIVDGLAGGIRAKAGAVADAVVAAASNAIAAAKRILGIASPSRVFAQIGDFTAQGFAIGIDGAANDVVDSARAMARDAAGAASAVAMMGPSSIAPGAASNANASGAGGSAGAGAAASAGGGGGRVYQFHFAAGAVVIQASSAAAGKEAGDAFYARVRELAEQA